MGEGLRFLIADTSAVERRRVSDALSAVFGDAEFFTAVSMSEFCSKFKECRCQIIISELKADGYSALRALDYLNTSNSSIPFIIFSSSSDVNTVVECIKRGAADYKTKDNLEGLVDSIRNIASNLVKNSHNPYKEDIELLGDIVEYTSTIYMAVDEKTLRIRYANSACINETGYSPEELIGMSPVGLFSGFSSGRMRNMLAPLIFRTRKKVSFYNDIIKSDGSSFQAEISLYPVFKTHETLILISAENITPKIKAQEHTSSLAQIIERSHTPITVTNRYGIVTYINQRVTEVTGQDPEAVIGESIERLKGGVTKGEAYSLIWKNVTGGRTWIGETRLLTKEGNEIRTYSYVSPIRNMNNEIVNLVFVDEDITEKETIREQLRHAQKMETLGELSSGIAHDFNNLLTAMGGFATIIRRRLGDDNAASKFADKILELAVTGRDITRGLLDYGRKKEFRRETVSIDDIVKKTSQMLAVIIAEDIVIDTELNCDERSIFADETQIGQVLMNLAVNARDAMPEGGTLSLETGAKYIEPVDESGKTCKIPGYYVYIKVADTGSGMSEDTRSNIFKPFFTTKTKGKGTGLGLAIVREIVEKHGGFIECSSVIGEGTTFSVYIPEAKSTFLAEKDAVYDTIPYIKGKTLVIDDDAGVRESIETMLQEFGYETISMPGCNELKEFLLDSEFDIGLAVVDIVLKDHSGLIAGKLLHERDSAIPVIYISGYGEDDLMEKGLEVGGLNIVRKPVFTQELLSRISAEISQGISN
ncbi:PAS domain S-box protein [Limisalsivibrio acetivorans]|uniref:PAS domain S-box protein n=1 Tax=Limisalsivibrio acetivorans TaxID=1304888 RepID=UPI0003B56264|nr:PAS domain S-box protein [Limisalsivibrio acetivorans]